MSNNHDDLLDRLDQDFAPGWQPEPGDKIAGVITDITHRDGGWGMYPVIELNLGGTSARTKDGQVTDRVAVHALHSVLKNELEQRRPAIGDRVAIKYTGKQTGKSGGADFEGYKLVHEAKNPASAWGDTATPTPTAPAEPYRTPEGEEPF